MPLETANYIAGLDASNPPPSDPKSQGDDHLRLIKSVLRNSFTGFAGSIMIYGESTGTGNSYVMTPDPALQSYQDGMIVTMLANRTNSGPATLNISGLGTRPIQRITGEALVAEDIVMGRLIVLQYADGAFQAVGGSAKSNVTIGDLLPAQAGNAGRFLQTDGTNTSWQWANTMVRRAITADTTATAADVGALFDVSGNVTLTLPNPALYSGWYCLVRNVGSGMVSLSSAANVDEEPLRRLRPGTCKVVLSAGSTYRTVHVSAPAYREAFTTSGTFTKEWDDAYYFVEAIGGGAGGIGGQHGLGGGGGGYSSSYIQASAVSQTVAVTVGGGGSGGISNASAGGDSSFGSLLAARGGRAAGGGIDPGAGGGGEVGSGGYSSGAGSTQSRGGFSCVMGGAGGGGRGGPGGISQLGGNGGTSQSIHGQAPGGGGFGTGSGSGTTTGGDGARGEVRVWRIKG